MEPFARLPRPDKTKGPDAPSSTCIHPYAARSWPLSMLITQLSCGRFIHGFGKHRASLNRNVSALAPDDGGNFATDPGDALRDKLWQWSMHMYIRFVHIQKAALDEVAERVHAGGQWLHGRYNTAEGGGKARPCVMGQLFSDPNAEGTACFWVLVASRTDCWYPPPDRRPVPCPRTPCCRRSCGSCRPSQTSWWAGSPRRR